MSPRLRRWGSALHLAVVLSLIVTLLSACGSSINVKETYPLESVSQNGSQTSYVYRAAGETVQEVAKGLVVQKKPDQLSKEDPDHMFLVYPDQIIHVQKDEQKPEDSLVEVDSKEYVRQNYSPSFLEGYLLASLIGNLFDMSRPGGYYGDYRGYGSQKAYPPPATGKYRAPTDNDLKSAPPMTVNKKGSIFKRGKTQSGSDVGSGGLFNKKPPSTSGSSGSGGSITRNKDGDSSSKSGSSWIKPRKSTKPRTSFGGSGRISRRR
ncbi:DUF4247 domain-containing protein [Cohnella nanjingensis]|uniref:DUF4247 domain-containing protein n=1 Tax=Cohnella nanjingensis TaxID=1387779 RepID=A0A7X0VDG3_9BACL|nr:DUF4247 domain-containing protein [Cohnella nanjingensis]MBB6669940.1 DUF4247 domain-containing protein [Cohnella nanjingensis]